MALTHTTHQLIKEVFPKLDYAIDATCGNGHDTLFLASLCSEKGQVISFDIQECAIQTAKNRIKENGLNNKVTFLCTSHENMQQYVTEPAQVIMFNLGYLPNADKSITTLTNSTINALNTACELLAPNSLLSILCYPGHKEGKIETEHVKEWIRQLDEKRFTNKSHQSTVPKESSPVLFIVQKSI